MTTIGQPLDRVDGNAKTTGAAKFAAEHSYPGLTHAVLVHATISRGRITALHTAEASAVPGVIAVVTHLNAPPMKPAPKRGTFNLTSLFSGTSVNYLQSDEVHWEGQPIAVVVAETSAAAREAAALVRAEYTVTNSSVDFEGSEQDAQPQPDDPFFPREAKRGDAEAALATAQVSLDLRYTTPPHSHNALELHSTIAVWDGDRLTVHDATQSIDWFRTHLALRFSVPRTNVRVLAPFVGGAFGGKFAMWPGTILAALAARATGRPVRLVLSREAVYRTVGGRTPSIQRVALGADRDGRLTSLLHTSLTRTGRVGGHFEQVTSPAHHLYASENILARHDIVRLDLLPNTFMRAPGESIGTFALESAIDELAYELGMDPIDLRLRNETVVDPIDGKKKFSHRKLPELYALGAERFGWHERNPEPRSTREGRWLVGTGVATAFHPGLSMPVNVMVRLSADGSVLVRCAFQEMGMGAATAQAQITADALGVPFDAVRVEYGDSDLPMGPAAGVSVQTASTAASVLQACEELKRTLKSMARKTGGDGHEEILRRAKVPHVEAKIGSETRLGRIAGRARFLPKFMRDGKRWIKAASGVQFCEVRVDAETGETRVSRWVGVFDIGRVINAKTAASQVRGGIVMGLGLAMAEETLVDPRNGRIMNPSLAEYHVPVHADVPPIDVSFLDDPDPTTPLGILGAGEVGIVGVGAAVANAVYHATGKRVRDLPITLDKLL
ncbi:xanthine dehydrogenase family protein molybdopterin-binding subunit [Streptomyces sp. ME02-8801-2C]|uniref:xanthine dehydrogenase family protein molybdopterin-binding subunit n=1 Tax=Streptomyces sp. ME02-8801-2C TaxID=3028680 RepID=UPI0029BE56E3|nr:xanthine dehydrogenase family protein molybdopterin-binding subunit [Streptomyces sp. ME02-8801-2C]MDX3458544.1 xanthine dehydrogenase family protein molybdopterin-binding subunit [Streptomyces sp. ME02-8801-2C]